MSRVGRSLTCRRARWTRGNTTMHDTDERTAGGRLAVTDDRSPGRHPGGGDADRLLVHHLDGHSRRRPRRIPSSAFSDTTGLTSNSVRIGNVSTLEFGLFKGAAVGTEAYADYVNAAGGVNGRKICRRQRRRPVLRRPQQGAHPGGHPPGLRHGRRVLAVRQFRGHGVGRQPPGAQHHRVVEPGGQRPAQHLQSLSGGRWLAARSTGLFQEQVPV